MRQRICFSLVFLAVATLPVLLGFDCGGEPSDSCVGKDCSDGNECTSDVCADDQCDNPNVADGTSCDGGNGACQSGACRPTMGPCVGKDCSDGNECTSDVCTDGNCTNPAVADGTSCDGGMGTCQDGTCEPVSGPCEGVDCSDGNECTSDMCTDGTCSNPAVADGTMCAGGTGTCQSGVCQSSDPCEGLCGAGNKDNCAPCDDANTCTANDCVDPTGIAVCANTPRAAATSCPDFAPSFGECNGAGVCEIVTCASDDDCPGPTECSGPSLCCQDPAASGCENPPTFECLARTHLNEGLSCDAGGGLRSGTCTSGVCEPNNQCLIDRDCGPVAIRPPLNTQCVTVVCNTVVVPNKCELETVSKNGGRCLIVCPLPCDPVGTCMDGQCVR